jgi:hypothetical protein
MRPGGREEHIPAAKGVAAKTAAGHSQAVRRRVGCCSSFQDAGSPDRDGDSAGPGKEQGR